MADRHPAACLAGFVQRFSLYQRGAPHSRDPLKAKNRKEKRKVTRCFTWVYRNFFSGVFVVFAVSLALHIVFGAEVYNEERAFTGQPSISIATFLPSAKFWSSALQTWQAEYLAIALFVVLSPFLRQEGSAESKPIGYEATGGANK